MARQPGNPFHPDEILLEEFLEPAGLTQSALAEKLGCESVIGDVIIDWARTVGS